MSGSNHYWDAYEPTRAVVQAAIVEQYEERGPGRIVCPVCKGGSSGEASLSVYLGDDGKLRGTCHRMHCTLGTVHASAMIEQQDVVTKSTTRRHYDTGVPATLAQVEDLFAQYTPVVRIIPIRQYVRVTRGPSMDAWVFPILNPMGDRTGCVIRPFVRQSGRPKAYTVFSGEDNPAGSTGVSYYLAPTNLGGPLYVVEDVISALVLRSFGLNAASLNGTLLSESRRVEMVDCSSMVVLMLDADATSKALKTTAQWTPAGVFRVARLLKDIKDCTVRELRDLFELRGLSEYRAFECKDE